MRKGQLAVEFLAVLAVLMLLFVVLMRQAAERQSQADAALVRASAAAALEAVAGSINAAVLAGNGSSAILLPPATLITGVGYELELHGESRLLEARWPLDVPRKERSRLQVPLITGAFSGSLPLPGENGTADYAEGVVRLG